VALKDLGFTLEQVQAILEEKVGVEEPAGNAEAAPGDLQSQIATDTARLAQIEASLQIIEREGAMPTDDVQIKRAFKDFVADWDATVVRRLKQAGAIIVGKTNVAFMLADYGQTSNELYGVTNNPWDTTRTPGGSTGGGGCSRRHHVSRVRIGFGGLHSHPR
jgi:DNA-binding transcriptional MerR regulator